MKIRAGIIGTGSAVPKGIVTNEDLSRIVETTDSWITERTGIKERRVTDYNTTTSDLAYEASVKALEDAKIDPSKIDLIIVATCSPDMLFPSVSCILQDKLKAHNAAAFDVSAACSGFNFALSVASGYIESGAYRMILAVGADTLTKYIDWKDRGTCVLFGDGAGATMLKAFEDGSGILSSYLYVEGGGGKHLIMPGGGSKDPESRNGRFIKMDGREVFKFGIRALEKSIIEVLKKADIKIEDMNLLIPHQANIRIIDHVIKKLNLPREKVFVNLERYGNTSAASIPIALDEAVRNGRVKKGDIVVLSGFGAGLTCGANVIKWSK